MIAELITRITKAISPREEPRMWEYYRVERAFEYIVTATFVIVLAGFFLWHLK